VIIRLEVQDTSPIHTQIPCRPYYRGLSKPAQSSPIWLKKSMRVPSALTLVRSHRPALPSYNQTDLAIGTTYSCVANYEGTNVEISMFPRVTETAGSLSGRLIGLTNTDLFLQSPTSRVASPLLPSSRSQRRNVSSAKLQRTKPP
jgi:hypothetical protein